MAVQLRPLRGTSKVLREKQQYNLILLSILNAPGIARYPQ
jgi:hypothetical protein